MGIPTPPTNGNGWVKLITQLGIPTVLAAVLLWFMIVRMTAVFDKLNAEMAEQTKALQRIESQLPKK